MKITKEPFFQHVITISTFIAALMLRLIRLGSIPLSDMEAGIALQALAVSRRTEALFDSQMAYVGLTGLDFFVFEPGGFLARFWPAFLGAFIVFIPYLFRDQIGRGPAAILTIALAVSPEMVGLSRIVGSPMMAFVGFFLSLGLINHHKPILAGMAFAIGLMSGAGFWTGILIVGLSVLALKIYVQGDFSLLYFFPLKDKKVFWVQFSVSFILTLLLVGTGFLLAPEGLTGIFAGAVDFFRGFSQPHIKPFWHNLLALIAYGVSAVVFGIWGGIHGAIGKDKIDIFLIIWTVLGCCHLLLNPAALPADILWVTLPLWTLAARVLFFYWKLSRDNRFIQAVTAITIVIVFVFILLALRSIINPTLDQQASMATLIAIAGGFVLLIGVLFLVSYGWSGEVALSGLLIGLLIVSLFGILSLNFRTTGLGSGDSYEIWYPQEARLSPRWLMVTIDRVLDWNKKRSEPIDIAVVDSDSPAMRWVLLDHGDTAFIPYLPPSSQPGILISDINTQPEIANSYQGQDLVWSRTPLWDQMSYSQYFEWLITHHAPAENHAIIIWVRTDLMPGDQLIP